MKVPKWIQQAGLLLLSFLLLAFLVFLLGGFLFGSREGHAVVSLGVSAGRWLETLPWWQIAIVVLFWTVALRVGHCRELLVKVNANLTSICERLDSMKDEMAKEVSRLDSRLDTIQQSLQEVELRAESLDETLEKLSITLPPNGTQS